MSCKKDTQSATAASDRAAHGKGEKSKEVCTSLGASSPHRPEAAARRAVPARRASLRGHPGRPSGQGPAKSALDRGAGANSCGSTYESPSARPCVSRDFG